MRNYLFLFLLAMPSGCGKSADLIPAATVTDTTVFAVSASGVSAYNLNGVNNPALTFKRGNTYTFNLDVAGHPFYIKSIQSAGTGNAYLTGVTGNGNSSGALTFSVPVSAPDTLYYNCSNHAAMTGVINITN